MTESEVYPDEDFVPFVGDDDETVEEPEAGEWDDGKSPYDLIADFVQDPDASPENGDAS